MLLTPRWMSGPGSWILPGSTTVIRATSSSLAGWEKKTFPSTVRLVLIWLPPGATATLTSPILLSSGQSPSRALSRGHIGTPDSPAARRVRLLPRRTPRRPSGRRTLTRLSSGRGRPNTLMSVLTSVSAAAVVGVDFTCSSTRGLTGNGSSSSARKGEGVDCPCWLFCGQSAPWPSRDVTTVSSGSADGGSFALTLPSPRKPAHGTTSLVY